MTFVTTVEEWVFDLYQVLVFHRLPFGGFQIGAGIIGSLDPDWGFYIIVILLATALFFKYHSSGNSTLAVPKPVTEYMIGMTTSSHAEWRRMKSSCIFPQKALNIGLKRCGQVLSLRRG